MPLPKKESLRDDLRACAERAPWLELSQLESRNRDNKITYRELRFQIEKRKLLIKQMVGSLYPAILSDEIDEIRHLLEENVDQRIQ